MSPQPPMIQEAGRQMALKLATNILGRLTEISRTLAQLLALQESPRKNFLAAGTLPGGGTVGTTPATCSVQPPVGASPGTILTANTHRRGLSVQNIGTTGNLTIGLGITQPTAGTGLVLPPSAQWDGRISGQLWMGSVTVVGSAAGVTFSYLEAMGQSSRTQLRGGPNEAV